MCIHLWKGKRTSSIERADGIAIETGDGISTAMVIFLKWFQDWKYCGQNGKYIKTI